MSTPRSSKSLKGSAPYLRDLRDLSIHGSIGPAGEWLLFPVFNGLGDDTASHPNLCAMLRPHPLFAAFAERHALPEPTTADFFHPALTSLLPLPAPAVIDATLAAVSGEQEARVRRQLQRAAYAAAVSSFTGSAYAFEDPLAAAVTVASMAVDHPGILTPPLAGLLLAWQNLLKATHEAAAARRFVLMRATDLSFALRLPDILNTPYDVPLSKPSWGGFYVQLRNDQGDLRPHLEVPEHRLLGPTSLARLTLLCQRSSLPFALVPDVGEAALMDYLREAHQQVGALSVKYQDFRSRGPQPKAKRRREGREDRSLYSPPRYGELFTSAWSAILGCAAAAGFYPEVGTTPAVLASAWARRYEAEGAYLMLQRYQPTRPIAGGGAVLAQPETLAGRPVMRLTPAVPRPEAATQKAHPKRPQQDPKRWLKLSELATVSATNPLSAEGSPSLKQVQVLWPQAELWQTIDMVKTLAAFPAFFLHPELLERGFAHAEQAAWDSVPWPEDGVHRGLAAKPWPTVQGWFLGTAPWPLQAKEAAKRPLYQDATTSEWPMTLAASSLSAGQVRLSVRYTVVGSSADLDAKLHLAQVLHGLQTARTIPGELYEAFQSLGESLRFEATPYFEVDGQAVLEADWFAAVPASQLYMRLPNGISIDAAEYAAKTEQFLVRQKVYAKFANLTYQQLWQVHRQATIESVKNLLPDEYLEQLTLKVAPVLQELDQQLSAPLGVMLSASALSSLAPRLRDYQMEGVSWCYLRLQLGLGVCLADEMGLGKTIQAMALLLSLKDKKRPSLVVMPKTVLVNWQRELAKFAPELRVRQVDEGRPEEAQTLEAQVWLLTYPRLRLGSSWLKDIEFQLVVLDEAQAIKNTDTQTAEAAQLLQARYRLALTGTPVENHAGELWSLIHWLNPGYLGRAVDFMLYIKLARSSAQKRAILAPLKACLEPLMLRRTKADPKVRLGLPPKILQDHACEVSGEQQALYEALLEVVFTEEVTGLSAFARRALFLKAIMHAKQICVHPDLFYGEETGLDEGPVDSSKQESGSQRFKALLQERVKKLAASGVAGEGDVWLRRSGKFVALAELLPELREASRGILIFTQYLGAARLMQRLLKELFKLEEPTAVLHGGLAAEARQKLVDDFNDSCLHRPLAAPLLILSLKAGGTGLNLTGADRVIHLDRWWNPAVEDQATDRTHRLGQTNTVFVHTLTSTATIEEAIAQMFIEKRRLADDLLGGAEAEHLGALLGSSETFLNLMDPQRVFTKRMLAAGVPLQLGKGNRAR